MQFKDMHFLCNSYSCSSSPPLTAHGTHSGDNFMNGLYRMFLGDARPHNLNDEWVFSDVDSIQEIIIPAARIALKVHQVCLSVCLSLCLSVSLSVCLV